MSDSFQLSAELRTDIGKGASRRLRRLFDRVPAIIYGGGKEATSVTFSHKELLKALENEAFYSHVVTLNIGTKEDQAILRDLQRHPSENRIIHADFLRVSKDQEINVHVPLHFLNQESCVGVKTGGGNISHLMAEVEVICLPGDLPEFIEIDMLALELGQSIHLSEIKLPRGVKLAALMQSEDHDLPVASVHAPRTSVEQVEESSDSLDEDESGSEEDTE